MIDYEKLKAHTPGPWRTGQEIRANTVIGENGYTICSGMIGSERQYMIYENWEQNAQLIAAAPDLLEENRRLREALEACRPYIEDLQSENFEDADACIGIDRDLDNAFILMQKALSTGCVACDAGVICHHHHKQIQDQP